MGIVMTEDERRAVWIPRIRAWRASGLSKTAFAQSQGLHCWQISYWAKRLADVPAASTTLLVPVMLKQPSIPSAPVASMLTLQSPAGWTMTIASTVSPAWLGSLLQSLP